MSPRKKPKKARKPARVDLRTPAEIAVASLRHAVRDIRKAVDKSGAHPQAFAIELRGDFAVVLLDEIDRVARAAKAMVSAWDMADSPKLRLAIDELRTVRGGATVCTRKKGGAS